MAFAPVFANCFLVARASRAEALAASWRPAERAAAYRPASSCCGDVVRIEAFLLIFMRHLPEVQHTSGDVTRPADPVTPALATHPGRPRLQTGREGHGGAQDGLARWPPGRTRLTPQTDAVRPMVKRYTASKMIEPMTAMTNPTGSRSPYKPIKRPTYPPTQPV